MEMTFEKGLTCVYHLSQVCLKVPFLVGLKYDNDIFQVVSRDWKLVNSKLVRISMYNP